MGDLDYLSSVRFRFEPQTMSDAEREQAAAITEKLDAAAAASRQRHLAFHWKLRFPGVFFDDQGRSLPEERAGFDAILGNPPYISNQTQSGSGDLKPVIEKLHGYSDDLYVHFTDLGFSLLRPGGGFGFIVSDTFFTLATKLRMRERLQQNRIAFLGQCDPFDATVDAAIFVAFKEPPSAEKELVFIQARPQRLAAGRRSRPQDALPHLDLAKIKWPHQTEVDFLPRSPVREKRKSASPPSRQLTVRHDTWNGLRLHRMPQELYEHTHKRAFFEPRPGTLKLFERFNRRMADLVEEWWDKIETSRKFENNIEEIRAYHRTLKPGDVTLVGLIAEGGQGMRTANNARFLAYLESTPQAAKLEENARNWNERWLNDPRVRSAYEEAIRDAGGDPTRPLADRAAWESAVHQLREQFTPAQIGFTKTSLFRIAPKGLIATESDFRFAWDSRRKELLRLWRDEGELHGFWQLVRSPRDELNRHRHLWEADDAGDADFCALCIDIVAWFQAENANRRRNNLPTIPKAALHLRSAEFYVDPADAPRIATIYNGLSGRGIFVPFRKGDPTGNRWADNEPLFVDWSKPNVRWFFTQSGRPESGSPVMRNAHLYFTPGVTWSLHANHVAIKARYQEACVFDASGSRLTPFEELLSAPAYLGIINSDVFSFLFKKFIKHNQDIEMNDMRMMPLVIPTAEQSDCLRKLAELAIAAKKSTFGDGDAPQETVAIAREWRERLLADAPRYLHPPAQLTFEDAAQDCLEIFERAINWEAEKLYNVEGQGPFDDF